ncbi:MAG: class III poly(R)-hydroxyalkanoic acid synthase subunit PhaC [Thermoplasmata archaeon]|nr:MAG: class III poly(R)-hydroxyalkanoic acid synthase subunit PhaC [Thermoplasmata archaeon]
MLTPTEQILEFNQNLVNKSLELNYRAQQALSNLTIYQNLKVGETESEVIYRDNKMTLLHYKPLTEKVHKTPLLVIYALINKPYILDLQPDKSVIRNLLSKGFDIYLIDWGTPSDSDKYLDFEDYVERYIDDVVNIICECNGVTSISILGYCIGGTLSAIYTALHPEKVRNFIMMASPVYFDTKDGLLHIMTDRQYFDADVIVDSIGNLPPNMLNSSFLMLDPVENFINKYSTFFNNMDNRQFVERFLRMEHWIFDSIPMTGEFYRRYIKELYQQNLLAKNEFYVGEKCVDLRKINMPVLNIIAKRDTQVPEVASAKLNELISSKDKKIILFSSGHIGLSVGKKAHNELWPEVAAWLKKRSGRQIKARN